MTIASDVQKLEPGNLVELFELNAAMLGGDVLRFHASTEIGSIWWQGEEYSPWPMRADGFARTTDQPPTPKLTVANIDGRISLLCMAHEDLVGARLIRRRTFAKYLDARNFPGGNAQADPLQEMDPEVWFIERKVSENPQAIEFELSSTLDFNGVQLPRRQIVANSCTSEYRGPECGYLGPAVATIMDAPTTDIFLDRCGKRLASCKLRWGEDAELPYGSFPAAGLVRT